MARIVEYQPRQEIVWLDDKDTDGRKFSIFLAGTIDMGNSEDWQNALIQRFYNTTVLSEMEDSWTYEFYNPRRPEGFGDDMDEFRYQYNWEQDKLRDSDKIIMCFLGSSKSPVTMMELGQYLRDRKLTVICDPKFWKFDAVRLACERHNTKFYTSVDEYFKDEIE